jgi:hypothetical protein
MSSQLRPITGNKNIDPFIRLAAVAAIGYGSFIVGRFIFRRIKSATTAPINPNPLPALPGCNISSTKQNSIKKQIDDIISHLSGINAFKYPEIVNVIAGYNVCELQYADLYYKNTYALPKYPTLYAYIYDEFLSTVYYSPALNALSNAGLN